MALVHIPEDPLLKIGVAQPSRVVVPEHALDPRGGQNLAHHVEHGVVVKRVADLLEFVQEPLQHVALDRVRRHEVEDQAVVLLAVAVDAPHPLLQAVRVPRYVVVEEDVAALEIDPLARRLGRHQNLNPALAKLLFGVEPGARLVPGTGLHASVDAAHTEAPFRQPLHQVVERVLELREQEQPLIRSVEEPFGLHDPP